MYFPCCCFYFYNNNNYPLLNGRSSRVVARKWNPQHFLLLILDRHFHLGAHVVDVDARRNYRCTQMRSKQIITLHFNQSNRQPYLKIPNLTSDTKTNKQNPLSSHLKSNVQSPTPASPLARTSPWRPLH